MSKILSDYAAYRNDRVSCDILTPNTYISVDNMLKDRGGIIKSVYVPKQGMTQAFKKHDILIGNIRPYFKKIWLAEYDGGCSPDVLVISPKPKVDPYLLYSILSSDHFFDYDMAGSKGSKMPRGDKNHIMKYPIFIELMDNKIGNLIYSINKKIELNNKIANKLEMIISNIYNFWFLQFDFPDIKGNPYKSSDGKMIFNSKFSYEIPEGWDVMQLKEVCGISLGGTPSTEVPEYWNGDIPWLNSGEIAKFPIVESEKKITQLGVDNSSAKLMKAGTVLVSITGNIRCSFLGFNSSANQSVVGVSECGKLKKEYIYQFLTNSLNRYTAISGGNCQKHINKAEVENTWILIPKDDILNKYYKKVSHMYKLLVINAKENLELLRLRDFLLPSIINGQAVI